MNILMLQDSETYSGIMMKYICIQAEDRDGRQPLHLAAQYGYNDVARILLDSRTDVNSRTKDAGKLQRELFTENKKVYSITFF